MGVPISISICALQLHSLLPCPEVLLVKRGHSQRSSGIGQGNSSAASSELPEQNVQGLPEFGQIRVVVEEPAGEALLSRGN